MLKPGRGALFATEFTKCNLDCIKNKACSHLGVEVFHFAGEMKVQSLSFLLSYKVSATQKHLLSQPSLFEKHHFSALITSSLRADAEG